MTTLKPLLARNRSWALQKCQHDPDYFEKWVDGQRPHSLWIGCSDSRVPAEVLTGSQPGELFVHRNIANMLDPADDNVMSVLQYALNYLEVERVVLCGHYGCGGVKAATEDLPHGLADHWLEPIRRLSRAYAVDLSRQPDLEAQRDRLAEFNVVEGVRRVCETPILQRAWTRGAKVRVHGLIYGLKDGLLRDLDCSVGPGHFKEGAAL